MKTLSIKKAVQFYLFKLRATGGSPNTMCTYQTELEQWREFIKTRFPSVRDIHQFHVRHLFTYQQHLEKLMAENKLKPATLKKKIQILKAFFKVLYTEKMIPQNIAYSLVLPQLKIVKKPDYLDPKEINLFLSTVKSSKYKYKTRDYAMLCVLYYLGVRISELVSLKWQDIDLTERIIRIYRNKNSTFEYLPMHNKLQEALSILYHQCSTLKKSDYVFLSKYNTVLTRNGCHSIIKKYIQQLPFKKEFQISAHTFRHSFISTCIKNNISLEEIQLFTGHLDANSLKYYTKLHLEDQDEVLEALG